MKIERLPNTAVVVQVSHMEIDGMEFTPPGDFDELIGDLCDADGMGSAIVLYNTRVKEVFEKAGLIRSNIRGGSYGTAKLKEYKHALEEAFYKQMPETKLSER